VKVKQRAFILILLAFLVACEAPVESVLEENIPLEHEVVEDVSQAAEPESYVVTYHFTHTEQIRESIFAAGEEVILTPIPRLGYVFVGWFFDEQLTQPVGEISSLQSDVNLYPKWDVIPTYVIRYHLTHENTIEEVEVLEGRDVTLQTIKQEGFRFLGWFRDSGLTEPVERVEDMSEDIDLYPQFEEIVQESYVLVFEDIRNHFLFDFTTNHPIDYYVSPSQQQDKADAIYSGMYQAAGLFEPYLGGFDPLSVTVVHPNDFEWYEEITATLDLRENEDPWFQRTSKNGGGAVFESYNGRPHMFFMVPNQNYPDANNLDWYVHETMHIFQLGLLYGQRDENLGCMYTEGGATLLGNVLAYTDELRATQHFEYNRRVRIQILLNYYAGESNLSEALYDQLVNGQNDRCNVQEPGFGYNLGALVAEKMVLDFGIENFMAMHYDFNRYRIDQVFEDRFDTNYFEWIEEEAVPYVKQLID
jgi:uncharacterized repeat protein (TIGR02543 family)